MDMRCPTKEANQLRLTAYDRVSYSPRKYQISIRHLSDLCSYILLPEMSRATRSWLTAKTAANNYEPGLNRRAAPPSFHNSYEPKGALEKSYSWTWTLKSLAFLNLSGPGPTYLASMSAAEYEGCSCFSKSTPMGT